MSAETPLVRRAVRTGGVFLAVAAVQFVVVALLVENRYPGYAMWTGSARALGSASSPWGLLFNVSLVVLGALGVLGLLFSWSAFDERPSRGVGLLVLLAASVAATCVGAFALAGSRVPSSAVPVATYVAVGAAGVGLLVIASAMHRHERWRVSRAYTFASGAAVLGGLVLYLVHPFGWSSGELERLAVGLGLVWAVVEGLHIALLHRFAPGLQVRVAAA
jgi:hypothetical membrane protein